MQSTRAATDFVAVSSTFECRRNRGMAVSRMAIAIAALMMTTVAGAQAIAPVGVLPTSASALDTAPRTADDRDDRASGREKIARIGLGVVGMAGGMVAGAMVGAGAAVGCRGEDCSLGSALLGAGVGAILGSAIAAGTPEIGSRCGALERVGEAAALSLVGGILGAAVIGGASHGDALFFGIVAGTSVGAGLGASMCR